MAKQSRAANFVSFVILVVVVVVVGRTCERYAAEPTVSAPATSERPLSPKRLEEFISARLGPSNRKVTRLPYFGIEGGAAGQTVVIRWAIDDNLTASGVRRRGQREAVTILQAITESGMDYVTVRVEGTYTLVDVYGHQSESAVLRGEFSRAKVDQINWPSFDAANVGSVADVWSVDSTLRK